MNLNEMVIQSSNEILTLKSKFQGTSKGSAETHVSLAEQWIEHINSIRPYSFNLVSAIIDIFDLYSFC